MRCCCRDNPLVDCPLVSKVVDLVGSVESLGGDVMMLFNLMHIMFRTCMRPAMEEKVLASSRHDLGHALPRCDLGRALPRCDLGRALPRTQSFEFPTLHITKSITWKKSLLVFLKIMMLKNQEKWQNQHENLAGHRRDETLLSSVFSNGYIGDESSFNKSENEYAAMNLSDSEVVSPMSKHSWQEKQ
nr:uncharacterized protein LOC109161751 isoform X2 [Ipomoea batatas]